MSHRQTRTEDYNGKESAVEWGEEAREFFVRAAGAGS
jgi:hypothetical protein